jgi:hypothetical protein
MVPETLLRNILRRNSALSPPPRWCSAGVREHKNSLVAAARVVSTDHSFLTDYCLLITPSDAVLHRLDSFLRRQDHRYRQSLSRLKPAFLAEIGRSFDAASQIEKRLAQLSRAQELKLLPHNPPFG